MKKILLLLFTLSLVHCTTEEKIHDIIIIGGGLMGSSTAYHLAKAGKQVLLIEQQDSIYTFGSSYGEARIARSNNRGNDIWSYLHNRSVKEVEQLIAFLNSDEGTPQYRMEDIYTTSPVSYLGRMSIHEKLMASLKRQKVDYKIAINREEGKEKFGVGLPDSVLLQREYNQHSGTINPKVLIQYLHEATRKKGSEIRYQQRVESILPENDIYKITVKDLKSNNTFTLKSKQVISAAGPYTGELLKDIAPYFDKLINPQRVFLAFYSVKPSVYQNWTAEQKQQLADAYPVINSSKGTRDGSFFSMIEYFNKTGSPVIKIGGHFQRSDIEDLDAVWKKELTAKEIAWSSNSTLSYFKVLNLPIAPDELELTDSYSCVYSLTENEVPIVSNLISDGATKNPNFIVLGGMSGVGAKGAMTYGLIGSHLLLGKTEEGEMYQAVRKALGFERLVSDVSKLEAKKLSDVK